MRNKICAECNSINGERATYCRKCNASLDGAVIKEVEVQIIKEEPKPAPKPKPAPRPAERIAPRSAPVRHEDIILPKRPAKPDVIYWPFVLSLVSMFLMLALIFIFVITQGKSDEPVTSVPAPAVTTSATTTEAAETSAESASDISQITIGDIADQMYTGDFITIPFSLTYNGNALEEGVDYTITYENNISVGTADVYFEGTGESYTGSFSTNFNIISGDPVVDDPDNFLTVNFVMRLSWTMLGRSPSVEELSDRVGRLVDGQITGAGMVDEIALSDECEARNLSDADFIGAFYQGALGRPADDDGLVYNTSLLAGGMSRADLINGIMSAPDGEFTAVCEEIGIEPL